MSTLGAAMAKDPEKKRIEIHVAPEVKDALNELAKKDDRSLLKYIALVLERHVKSKQKK